MNVNKAGTYKITYKLEIEDYKKELTRQVIVKEKNNKEIVITLKGESVVYLNKNENYIESGVTAYLGNEDVSKNVKIENNIMRQVGNYEVKYTYGNKSITRKIIVIDVDSYFQVDEKNRVININLDDNIKYVVLPTSVVNTNKSIKYEVMENGDYKFYVYTKNSKKYEKIISIKIVVEPPKGSCIALLKDGKTTYTVNTNDTIKSYNYNGTMYNGKTYTVNKYIRKDAYVIITNTYNASTKLNCEIKMEALPVKKPDGKLTYSEESDTLKVYIKKTDGWILSYVWAFDPSRQLLQQNLLGEKSGLTVDKIIKKAVINNNYKNKIVLGFNTGDWLKTSNDKFAYQYAFDVENGKSVYADNKKEKRAFIYYISGNNQLSYVELKEKSNDEIKNLYQKILNDDAYNTFHFSPTLVENGIARDKIYDKESSYEYTAYRQGLCQIDTNNFILVSSKTAKTKNTVEFGKYMKQLGCKTAFNLDGGGSVQTAFKPKGTNSVELIAYNKIKNSIRANHKAMYFTELN